MLSGSIVNFMTNKKKNKDLLVGNYMLEGHSLEYYYLVLLYLSFYNASVKVLKLL